MTKSEILRSIARRTCSIGVLKVSPESYLADLTSSSFKIFGTGFLIGKNTVLTNRHVVVALQTYVANNQIPADRSYAAFLHPAETGINQTFCEIDRAGAFGGTTLHDLGILVFRSDADGIVSDLSPVTVPPSCNLDVGDPIAVYGYAFCENLLKREVGEKEEVYRMGAILQQGYISAFAPYDASRVIDRILLDVRTSRGMSGSPVFDPLTGEIVGIHDAGVGETVAFAIPLSAGMVNDILKIRDSATTTETSNHDIARVMRAGAN